MQMHRSAFLLTFLLNREIWCVPVHTSLFTIKQEFLLQKEIHYWRCFLKLVIKVALIPSVIDFNFSYVGVVHGTTRLYTQIQQLIIILIIECNGTPCSSHQIPLSRCHWVVTTFRMADVNEVVNWYLSLLHVFCLSLLFIVLPVSTEQSQKIKGCEIFTDRHLQLVNINHS